jgi:hypothetical protein
LGTKVRSKGEALDKSPPKKERYVVYVDPEVGLALREHVAKVKNRTYSAVAEEALRRALMPKSGKREPAMAG